MWAPLHSVLYLWAEGDFSQIPVIDQTHLSFQRGQEAWLAEFEKWWGRKQRSSFSSQTHDESITKCGIG